MDSDPAKDVDNISADHDAAPGWNTAWSALRSTIARNGQRVGPAKYRLQPPLSTRDAPTPSLVFDEIITMSALAIVQPARWSSRYAVSEAVIRDHSGLSVRIAFATGAGVPTATRDPARGLVKTRM